LIVADVEPVPETARERVLRPRLAGGRTVGDFSPGGTGSSAVADAAREQQQHRKQQ